MSMFTGSVSGLRGRYASSGAVVGPVGEYSVVAEGVATGCGGAVGSGEACEILVVELVAHEFAFGVEDCEAACHAMTYYHIAIGVIFGIAHEYYAAGNVEAVLPFGGSLVNDACCFVFAVRDESYKPGVLAVFEVGDAESNLVVALHNITDGEVGYGLAFGVLEDNVAFVCGSVALKVTL